MAASNEAPSLNVASSTCTVHVIVVTPGCLSTLLSYLLSPAPTVHRSKAQNRLMATMMVFHYITVLHKALYYQYKSIWHIAQQCVCTDIITKSQANMYMWAYTELWSCVN